MSALREAVEALLSNEEHATSGGMRSYAVGSPTWDLWEYVRQAMALPDAEPAKPYIGPIHTWPGRTINLSPSEYKHLCLDWWTKGVSDLGKMQATAT